MKDHLLPISILLSAVIICAGMFSLSNTIQNRPFAGTPYIPSSLEVDIGQARDYMTEYEAASYLRMDDDRFHAHITGGALDGTFTTESFVWQEPDSTAIMTKTIYIFAKSKLDEWMMERIETQNN